MFNQFDKKFKIEAQIKDLSKNVKKRLTHVMTDNFKQFFSHLKSEVSNAKNEIDPLTLDPSSFIGDILNKDQFIEPIEHFPGDIGS